MDPGRAQNFPDPLVMKVTQVLSGRVSGSFRDSLWIFLEALVNWCPVLNTTPQNIGSPPASPVGSQYFGALYSGLGTNSRAPPKKSRENHETILKPGPIILV